VERKFYLPVVADKPERRMSLHIETATAA